MNKLIKTDLGNKEIFIRNLKRQLEVSGKTKGEVAKTIGVSTGNFADWLAGRSYPRMDKVQRLAEFFGVQMSNLVDDVNFAKESVSEKDQKVLDLFHEVPLNRRDAAIEMIESVLKTLSKL